MNTKEIDDLLLRLLDANEVNFLGVFAKDLIPNIDYIFKFPACLVLNSDESHEPGTHWLAVYYPNYDVFEFYDSYGQDPIMYSLPTSYLPHSVLCNNIQIQCIDSNVCAAHCIYYLHRRCDGFSMHDIVTRFSPTNLRGNDMFVARQINKYLRKRISFKHCPSNHLPSSIIQISHSRKHGLF